MDLCLKGQVFESGMKFSMIIVGNYGYTQSSQTAAYCSPSAGHGGIHKTLEKLKKKRGMASDVQIEVKNCNLSKCRKTDNT